MNKSDKICVGIIIVCLIVVLCLISRLVNLNYLYLQKNQDNLNDLNKNVDIYTKDVDIYKNSQNNLNNENYKFNLDQADKNFDSVDFNYEKKRYKNINTSYIVEEGYKESFETNMVLLDIVDRSKNDNIVVTVLPVTDLLGNYNMVKSNDNYSIFSYFSSGKGEEIYRCYIQNNKIIYVKNIESGKIYTVDEYSKIFPSTVKNVEECFKYYTEYIQK